MQAFEKKPWNILAFACQYNAMQIYYLTCNSQQQQHSVGGDAVYKGDMQIFLLQC